MTTTATDAATDKAKADAFAYAVWMVGNMDTAEDKAAWWADFEMVWRAAADHVRGLVDAGMPAGRGFAATGLPTPPSDDAYWAADEKDGAAASGPRTTATIRHAEGVRFRDLQDLDEVLMSEGAQSLAPLYERGAALLAEWNGPFVVDAEGKLLVADADSKGRCRYGSTTRIDSLWTRSVTEAVASRLVAGELVVEIQEEGQPSEYLVITPGSFDVRDEF